MAIECNVPIIPGVDHAVRSLDEVMEVARKVGYPVMLKASNGGGGRGMRIVNSEEEMPKEFEEARNEAKKAFGDDKIFVEKYLRDPKHIEVQVLGDKYGNVVHLFDRDCSVQKTPEGNRICACLYRKPACQRKNSGGCSASVQACRL